MVTPQDVIQFWCYDCQPEDWYKQDEAFDAQIRERFGDAVVQAQNGGFKDWEDSREGVFALIILLDQFSRNIFRGDAQSFAGDARARDLSRLAVERGYDMATPIPERQFFLMPLMHSEELSDQDDCIIQMAEKMGEKSALHARVHREIIARFGRFPYRNDALGRDTTPEEQAFLDGGGYGAIVRELEAAGES